MKLYTFIYGDGLHEPLHIEEEMPFESFNEAVKYAKRTASSVMKQHGDRTEWNDVFVLVDGGDKLMTRINMVDAKREPAEAGW